MKWQLHHIQRSFAKPTARLTVLAIITCTVLGIGAWRAFALGGAGSTAPSASELRQPIANSNGLVAWYKFDGDLKDSSGNHNDLTGTVSYTAGKFGQGITVPNTACGSASGTLTPNGFRTLRSQHG